jgi:hypothetical protein
VKRRKNVCTQTWTEQIVLYKQKFFITGFFISESTVITYTIDYYIVK